MPCTLTNKDKNSRSCPKVVGGVIGVYIKSFDSTQDETDISLYSHIDLTKDTGVFTAEVQGDATGGFAFLRTLSFTLNDGGYDPDFLKNLGNLGQGVQVILEYPRDTNREKTDARFRFSGNKYPMFLTGGGVVNEKGFDAKSGTDYTFTGMADAGTEAITPVFP